MVSIELDITFFIQMGLFIVLVYLLNILVYKPVFRVMEERKKKVTEFESIATLAEENIQEKIAEYKVKIGEAKERGNERRAELKKNGLEKEADIIGSAHEEARKSIAEAVKTIDQETENALAVLRGMTEEMGKSIADKVLGRV